MDSSAKSQTRREGTETRLCAQPVLLSRQEVITRVGLVLAGMLLVIAAFAVDFLGYGSPGSFGLGQALLTLLGGFLALGGILGKRFFAFYRDAAAILATSLLLLACLELAAIVVGRTHHRALQASIRELPYYRARDWTTTYWEEQRLAMRVRYAPHVGWQHLPLAGATINIDQDGFRATPGADCREGAYRVFALGGSTMLGWGAPDWGTIPAHLQPRLESLVDGPVCVVNLGQDGFVFTQSLILLVSRLQSGDVPDLVLFYGGFNEVLAAAESGLPGAHVTLADIASRFEGRESPIVSWLRRTRLYAVISRWTRGEQPLGPRLVYRATDVAADRLAREVADAYFVNLDITTAISEAYGFDAHHFLQPQLAVGGKPLTEREQRLKDAMDPAFAEFAHQVYESIAARAKVRPRAHDVASAFDATPEQIWIDTAGHVTPDGNRLIADAMLAAIGDR